jgi:eukaryotic-like serine/threonine-protein kinase
MVVGEVVAGRYELERLVGSGGMSSVYRAYDRVLDRRVAIKLLHERLSHDENYLTRFRREARAAAQLNHPNIVTVIDRGEERGRPYIVFEFIDGETLKHVVEQRAPLSIGDAVSISLQVAEALAFAHTRGVIHRDIKPQNVMLADGRAKVTDFGIARSLDSDAGVTQTGTVLGTSDYMAPEQALGEHASERSDVYSLGAVLYELLTGDVLFSGESFVAVALKHASEPPPSVLERRPDCPVRLAAAVDRCLAKDPRERFASMNELIDELHECLADLERRGDEDATLIVAPAKRARPVAREARRRRVLPWLILLLGIPALAAVIAVVVVERNSIRDALPIIGSKSLPLKAVSAYDPYGDNGTENNWLAQRATDGNPDTYWATETYLAFTKPGVGLVLRADKSARMTKLTMSTDTPHRFRAQVRAGTSVGGPFTPVSSWQRAQSKTTFSVDTHGDSYHYYEIWLRLPTNAAEVGGVAKINEVTARER